MLSCENSKGDYPILFEFEGLEVEHTLFYSVNGSSDPVQENIPSSVQDKFEGDIENGEGLLSLRELDI